MKCPSEESLLSALVGELSTAEQTALDHHAERCLPCAARRREHRELVAALSALPVFACPAEQFIESVLGACSDTRPREHSRWYAGRSLAFWSAGAAAAALFLFSSVATLPPALESALSNEPAAHQQARGAGANQHTPAFADLLFVRDGVAARLSGALLRPGDALAVRCTNRGPTDMFLAVFVVDAGGSTHWVYPAYDDPTEDPHSVPIAKGLSDRLLDEVVEPAAPAAGPLRAYAVWSSTPLGVHAIEAHLDQLSTTGADSFFARAYVQRWSATWNVP